MSLLVTRDELLARRPVATGPLAALAGGLRRELEPLISTPPDVPLEKALLSRAGGRCEQDGTLLEYDPLLVQHRCPRCGRTHAGVIHDRFRLYWHHLWLAERAVHGALLGVLLDDSGARDVAVHLLGSYADRYLAYPNVDNVLGPSRPFFSTYLESIWLLQLCVALDLLELGAPSDAVSALGARVRERLIEPSAALIASYDEGLSNRQVWNNAALMAAGALLGDDSLIDRASAGPSGLGVHLAEGLLADGSWYEGENYHLFAHRGLWYGVRIAETNGRTLARQYDARFREGFAAPFRTLLPDLTFPSRRDSQYAVSVRQPRFAESCELGLARSFDERLASMLARLYDESVPRGETGRRATSADVERNLSPTGLSRADLSWRSLLVALPELPPLVATPFTSDLLPAQGLAILRRDDGCTYVALDYGHAGGGHGHPDRLNLLVVDGHVRWFDDPGTGSYVDESLHWYRSTLAHTAPVVDAHSQPPTHGSLVAFDDDGQMGWVSATARLLPDLEVRRSVVLMPDYLIDVLEWEAPTPHEIGLPLQGVDAVDDLELPLPRSATRIRGGTAKEDGFSHLRDGQRIATRAGEPVRLRRTREGIGNATLDGWALAPAGATWERALAPDAPSRAGLLPLLLVRATAATGRIAAVWSWRSRVTDVGFGDDGVDVQREDGTRDLHRPTSRGWHIVRTGGERTEDVMLTGHVTRRTPVTAATSVASRESPPAPLALPATFELGERHYRRSEATWHEAGQPRATATLAAPRRGQLQLRVRVSPSHRRFVPIATVNELDNEPAAINGDGVQLYVEAGDLRGGWLLVPRSGTDEVEQRPVEGWTGGLRLDAGWREVEDGWELEATIGLPGNVTDVGFDLLVNETAPGRARRRGQLVLSGADGEFVYLRGDRHDATRLLRFALPDG
ncbi:MAG TPA: heparinase II/III family protein [Gemmatimonadaceae bacterium]|nr:heparinase II/III family protein [Gemmatimonadaceae bacterium]